MNRRKVKLYYFRKFIIQKNVNLHWQVDQHDVFFFLANTDRYEVFILYYPT